MIKVNQRLKNKEMINGGKFVFKENLRYSLKYEKNYEIIKILLIHTYGI